MSDEGNGQQPQPQQPYRGPLGRLPEGMQVIQQAEFGPQLAESLKKAKQSGNRYMITVTTDDGSGELQHHVTHGQNWNHDLRLRAHRESFALSVRRVFADAVGIDGTQGEAI